MASNKQFSISINDFSGGINTLDAPHQMKTNEWRGYNFDIIGTGQLQKRFGYSKVTTMGTGALRGLHAYRATGNIKSEFLLGFGADGNLYTITPDNLTAVNQGSWGTDDGNHVGAANFTNLAIFGNGNPANDVAKFGESALSSSTSGTNTTALFTEIKDSGFLIGDTNATSTVATWAAVTDGEFAISIDGVLYNVTGIDFSGVTSMELVATRIETGITNAGGSATVVWDTDHFIITSSSTALTSNVADVDTVSGGTGTDISGVAAGAQFMDCDGGTSYLAQSNRYTIGAISSPTILTQISLEVASKGTGDFTLTLHDASHNEVASKTVLNADLANTYIDFILNFEGTGTYHFHLTSTSDATVKTSDINDLSTLNSIIYTSGIGTISTVPKGNIFENHPRTLFVAGVKDSPSTIYWCDLDDPTNWSTNAAGNSPISKEDGEVITGIKVHNDQKIVFKEYSKYGIVETINTDDVTFLESIVGFIQKEIIDKSDGTLSGRSIVDTWDGFIFYGEKGFQKYGIEENFPDRRVPTSISDLIIPTVNNINKKCSNCVVGISDIEKPYYYFSTPLNSDTNNFLFILNKKFSGNPWQFYTGLSISDFAVFKDENGDRVIHFIDPFTENVYKFNDKFIDDYEDGSGSAIRAYYRSKTFIPSYKNWWKRVLIRGAMTNPCEFKVTLNVDGNSYTTALNQENIQWSMEKTGVVGYDVVGHTLMTGTQSDEMEEFLAEIQFPSNINEGREFYIEIESNKINEGIRIDWIDIEGEKQSSEIIK